MSAPLRLPRPPEAGSASVADLVERVRRGLIRMPLCAGRPLWQGAEVAKLFDSLLRGLPIGSLLFLRKAAEAERLTLGPLVIAAPETSDAWWVLDGQERLTALAAVLGRSIPLPAKPGPGDPYALYFDPDRQRFLAPSADGEVPARWIPAPVLGSTTLRDAWLAGSDHGSDSELRRAVLEAGSRLREARLPLHLVAEDSLGVAEELYERAHPGRQAAGWPEVRAALFPPPKPAPATLEELALRLASVGMGRLEEDRLFACVQAIQGLDPTRGLAERQKDRPLDLRQAMAEALPVLRRLFSFLRSDALIPRLLLLPGAGPVEVLARFFALHSEPKPRTRTLLVRWLWRAALSLHRLDSRALVRQGLAGIAGDEEKSAQNLLALLAKERPEPFEIPRVFDLRLDECRLALLALAKQSPLDLGSGQPVDPAGRIDAEGEEAFAKIVDVPALAASSGAANRMFRATESPARGALLHCIGELGVEHPILASHAIDREAAEHLASGDLEGFLRERERTLTIRTRELGEHLAAWDYNDRPSIEYILETVESAT